MEDRFTITAALGMYKVLSMDLLKAGAFAWETRQLVLEFTSFSTRNFSPTRNFSLFVYLLVVWSLEFRSLLFRPRCFAAVAVVLIIFGMRPAATIAAWELLSTAGLKRTERWLSLASAFHKH